MNHPPRAPVRCGPRLDASPRGAPAASEGPARARVQCWLLALLRWHQPSPCGSGPAWLLSRSGSRAQLLPPVGFSQRNPYHAILPPPPPWERQSLFPGVPRQPHRRRTGRMREQPFQHRHRLRGRTEKRLRLAQPGARPILPDNTPRRTPDSYASRPKRRRGSRPFRVS